MYKSHASMLSHPASLCGYIIKSMLAHNLWLAVTLPSPITLFLSLKVSTQSRIIDKEENKIMHASYNVSPLNALYKSGSRDI